MNTYYQKSLVTDIKMCKSMECNHCEFYLFKTKGERYTTYEWRLFGLFKMGKQTYIATEDVFKNYYESSRVYNKNELRDGGGRYKYEDGKFIMMANMTFITGDNRKHQFWFVNDNDCENAYKWLYETIENTSHLYSIDMLETQISYRFNGIRY